MLTSAEKWFGVSSFLVSILFYMGVGVGNFNFNSSANVVFSILAGGMGKPPL